MNLVSPATSSTFRLLYIHVLRENVICVLNDCPVAIRIRWSNVLHDKMLYEIALFVRAHLAPSASMVVNIGEGYAFPIHIYIYSSSGPSTRSGVVRG